MSETLKAVSSCGRYSDVTVTGVSIQHHAMRIKKPTIEFSFSPSDRTFIGQHPGYVNAQPVAGLSQFMCDSITLSESGNSL